MSRKVDFTPETLDNNAEIVNGIVSDKDEVNSSDVVLLHDLVLCAAADNIDAKTIFVAHGGGRQWTFAFDTNMYSRQKTGQHFLSMYVDDIRDRFATMMEDVDVIVANSDFVARNMKEYYGIDVDVIYPPIDTDKFKPTDDETEDFFLSVQRIVGHKRVEIQIEAFKNLDEELVIVGDGEYSKIIRREAKKYDNITYLGRVSDEKLIQLYNQAKATIQTAMKEDWGYIPREGMACGTPFIVGYEGGFKDLVDKTNHGTAFNADDKLRSLKNVVRTFDESEYNSEEMRKFVIDNYSRTVIGEQYEEIIEEITNE